MRRWDERIHVMPFVCQEEANHNYVHPIQSDWGDKILCRNIKAYKILYLCMAARLDRSQSLKLFAHPVRSLLKLGAQIKK